ncbi:MAG: autotransporter-associated beta strand repeat-containing protein [Phycisphaerae bacterium]
MIATIQQALRTSVFSRAAGVSLVACLVAPTAAAPNYWIGTAGDGVWEAGASQNNWLGGVYSPAPSTANEYRFVVGGNATEQITLQGGHQPIAQFMVFDSNANTPLNITVDGTGGSKLVFVPDTRSPAERASGAGGDGETVRVEPGFQASIDASNDGVVELSGNRIDMFIGNNALLRVDAPVVGTGSSARILTTGEGLLALTNNASTFEGGVHSQSAIDFTSVGNAGEPSSLGTGAQGNIQIGSPFQADNQIRYIGTGTQTTDREIVLVLGRGELVAERRVLSQEGTLILTGGIRQLRNETPISRLRLGGGGDIEVRNVGISGGIDLFKIGTGTVTLGTASTYAGNTQVFAGTLRLEADNALPQDSNLWLRGNVEVADVLLDLGTLELAGDSFIIADEGTPFDLSFANSSEVDWEDFTLDILNWTPETLLRFGTDATGLTPTQLSLISIDGVQAVISSDGFISPVPEPGTLALLGPTALMTLRRRRAAGAC